jgi:hypothetical protein
VSLPWENIQLSGSLAKALIWEAPAIKKTALALII